MPAEPTNHRLQGEMLKHTVLYTSTAGHAQMCVFVRPLLFLQFKIVTVGLWTQHADCPGFNPRYYKNKIKDCHSLL